MSTDAITHTARLPHGFHVTFSWSTDNRLQVEWDPHTPRIRSSRHRRKFREAYEAARREFIKDVATVIGGNVGVVDLDGQFEVLKPSTKH
jgi:hypothetical protein